LGLHKDPRAGRFYIRIVSFPLDRSFVLNSFSIQYLILLTYWIVTRILPGILFELSVITYLALLQLNLTVQYYSRE
jgi:hypothetical protein